MIKAFLSFCAVCFILLAFVAGGVAYSFSLYKGAGPLGEAKQVTIPKGTGVSGIASILSKEGLIDHPFLFKVMARVTDMQGSLKAGEYEFSPSVSMADILTKLAEGKVILRQITIPEGKTSHEIVRLLKAKDDLTQDFETLPAEGALLPDTYSYQSTDSVVSVLAQMESAMKKTLDEAWEGRAKDLPITTKEEAIILASIVEKETGVASERATIAGVFVNRLNAGMPLQTDPTVIYAITKGAHKNDGKGPLGRRLLRKDLEIDSPYNTYKYAGLPKGPICNPGKEAILAALNPEKNDYIYFVADGTGGHIFSKTLAEHNRNVAKWRKIRKQQNK
ncbi:MAG: endolytic transglycosylase MltG [Bdellovibrionales bacterium]